MARRRTGAPTTTTVSNRALERCLIGGASPSSAPSSSSPSLNLSLLRHEAEQEPNHDRGRRRTATSFSHELAGTSSWRRRRRLVSSAATSSFRAGGCRASLLFAIGVSCLVGLALHTLANLAEAKSIDGSAPAASDGHRQSETLKSNSLEEGQLAQAPASASEQTLQEASTATPATKTTSSLADLIKRITSALSSSSPSTPPTATTTTATQVSPSEESTTTPATATTTTTALTTTTNTEDENGPPGAGDDDYDAEDCQGLSGGASAPGEGPSDRERLVSLQACLQKKVKRQLMGAARSGMEMFNQLALSGACTASLFNLMSSLGELKGFAFKFLDASAKIPSGMMSGLLSDFGDFEQCLAIRSNPAVEPRLEPQEGGYSGKYCLFNIRLRYHIRLSPNASAPEGIYPDGVLWDELVRNYWTSNTTKGFQLGVCVPSRCNLDDLEQMLGLFAESYHFHGDISACQDGEDVRRQQEPDAWQWALMGGFLLVGALNLLGTTLDLCRQRAAASRRAPTEPNDEKTPREGHQRQPPLASLQLLVASFSVRRNWLAFVRGRSVAGERRGDKLLRLLWGLKLAVLVWITVGHSFLYPSANNYQHYRSIINMNITRTSVWFATTNFILGIDMLLYMVGLLFVYQLARPSSTPTATAAGRDGAARLLATCAMPKGRPRAAWTSRLGCFLLRRLLRVWPAQLSVVALAVLVPLVSTGPMWPEMVGRRLGETCRSNWWANLLMVNNLLGSGRVCVPASWFISVVMQCYLVGAAVLTIAHRCSVRAAAGVALLLVVGSSSAVFWLARASRLNAPAIRMDESFVMELDENIFRMYTSTLSNLGPFLVGMLGGFVLLWHMASKTTAGEQDDDQDDDDDEQDNDNQKAAGARGGAGKSASPLQLKSKIERIAELMFELNVAFAVALIGLVVLSSVFFTSYTPFWSAIYWSCHRVGWAIVTGYLIHQCSTGKWRLLRRLLSLDSLAPLGRLILLAHLVHPLLIHIHSGQVRDGLHVSLYNMLNIYISRLVMTFGLALALHLLVELPVCSVEENLLNAWLDRKRLSKRRKRWLARGQQLKQDEPAEDDNRSGRIFKGLTTGKPYRAIEQPTSGGLFERQQTNEKALSGGEDEYD